MLTFFIIIILQHVSYVLDFPIFWPRVTKKRHSSSKNESSLVYNSKTLSLMYCHTMINTDGLSSVDDTISCHNENGNYLFTPN